MPDLEKLDNYIVLQQLCKENIENLSSYSDESSQKIVKALVESLDHLKSLPPVYNKTSRAAPLFDFDAETPGNGYRSFLIMVDRCLERYVAVNKRIQEWKNLYFFMRSYHANEIDAYARLLASLCTCFEMIEKMYDWNEERGQLSLFSGQPVEELMVFAENIDQLCFYGRCMGLQFCESVRLILHFISIIMTSYSELYYKDGKLLSKIGNCFKYLTDPETRAKRMVQISQWAGVDFCKSLWGLSENDPFHILSSFVLTKVEVNRILHIPPEELIVTAVDGSLVEVPIPMSHIGLKSIQVRLLSNVKRVGMVGTNDAEEILANKSEALVIHCHGGGFVAQTSQSHQLYLRKWTKKLNIPILSIDYSLAPEAPFPRALEEVIYVYGWVLKHGRSMLGTTLGKIIMAGDSAGCNLCITTTLKLMQLNLRLPDGIFMAYTPVLIDFVSSPSRLLGLADPLLPFGFLMRCLKAYVVVGSDKIPVTRLKEVGKNPREEFMFYMPKDPMVSPYLASDQELAKMPPFKILTLEADVCLDDSVTFGKKLKELGVPVTLDILPGLVHGFLNFAGLSKESRDATHLCAQRIQELVNGQ